MRDERREALNQKLSPLTSVTWRSIGLWVSGNLFSIIAWQGNFEAVGRRSAARSVPSLHAIWDPHFGQGAINRFTQAGRNLPVNIAYSGLYTGVPIGMTPTRALNQGILFMMILSAWRFRRFGSTSAKVPAFLAGFKNATPWRSVWFSAPSPDGHLVQWPSPRPRGQHVGFGRDKLLNVLSSPAVWLRSSPAKLGGLCENPDTSQSGLRKLRKVLVQRSSPSWVASSPVRALWLPYRPPHWRSACPVW